MANVAYRVIALHGGQVYADIYYDEATYITQSVRYANTSPYTASVQVYHTDGSLWFNVSIPPGTAEQSRNITTPRRWNLNTDPWPRIEVGLRA